MDEEEGPDNELSWFQRNWLLGWLFALGIIASMLWNGS